MRKILGLSFKFLGIAAYLIGGFWGLILCVGIVNNALGFLGVVVSLFLFPFLITLAPLFDGFANGEWMTLMVVYGGGLVGFVLHSIGFAISGE